VKGPPVAHHLLPFFSAQNRPWENTTAVIWKMLLVAQLRFRRLNAPELMKEIYHGAEYVNGGRVQERAWGVAA